MPGLKAAALSLGILYTVAHIIQVFGFSAVMMVSPQRFRFRLSSVTGSDLPSVAEDQLREDLRIWLCPHRTLCPGW